MTNIPIPGGPHRLLPSAVLAGARVGAAGPAIGQAGASTSLRGGNSLGASAARNTTAPLTDVQQGATAQGTDNDDPRGLNPPTEVNQENPNRENNKGKRQVTLKIATLNTRGLRSRVLGSASNQNNGKLIEVMRIMRTNKYGLMALQETHESIEAAETMERLFPKAWCFPNGGTSRSMGTMIILHNDFIPDIKRKEEITHEIIIPGRAHTIKFKWREDTEITVLNIYTPNDKGEAIAFFEELENTLTRTRKPDIVMGDWNHVEDAIDRLPRSGYPPQRTTEALRNFRNSLGITDGWREQNPATNSYTWTSAGQNADGIRIKSRLDRILVSDEMNERCNMWQHESSLNLSDHDIASVEIIDELAPTVGRGQWRMALEDLDDPEGIEQCRECLTKAEKRMTTGNEDPMTVWLETKEKIKHIIQNRQQKREKERQKKLPELKRQLAKIIKRPGYENSRVNQDKAKEIGEKITEISKAKIDKAAATGRARYALKGEAVNKYWFSIGKTLNKQRIIPCLDRGDGTTSTETEEMSEIMRKHHEKLQTRPEMNGRREAIERMKALASESKLNKEERDILGKDPTESDARIAIKRTQGGKAPGPDGIIYEFYKRFIELESKPPDDKHYPNIPQIMTRVWNANSRLRKKGVPKKYNEGAMHLAFKKGDKKDPKNYRPLTLLNTDYKWETKIMAMKLAETLPRIIHRDQAGFVPGRDILDQVKLAKIVTEYCEYTELDGNIIALDQEKAYDRIDHDYLWEILKAYGVHFFFIERMKHLYNEAETTIMVNRTQSRPFAVNRGVRQGDPLSCLIFDLAIEPLAESLRRSDLKGIKIPGEAERLIAKFYADDTMLYLAKSDRWTKVLHITNDWCLASTAKFNNNKLEVLPLGSKEHREAVVRTRTLKGQIRGHTGALEATEILPPNARILSDGEALRVLGGYTGHNIDTAAIWEPVTSKIEALADKWSNRSMTLKGRKLIVSFIILSRAHYLMMVNDPPQTTTTRIIKAVRKVMWKGKPRGAVNLDELYRDRETGGLDLPNFANRQAAGRLTWVARWRKEGKERPTWAPVLDALLKNASGDPRPHMTSLLDQTWKEKGRTLSREIRLMLKEARDANIQLQTIKTRTAKDTLPIWDSKYVSLPPRRHTTIGMKTLKNIGIIQQGQLDQLDRVRGWETERERTAAIMAATEIKEYINKPFSKNNVDHSPNGMELNEAEKRSLRKEAPIREDEPLRLDPNYTDESPLRDLTRIFVPERPAQDQTNNNTPSRQASPETRGTPDFIDNDPLALTHYPPARREQIITITPDPQQSVKDLTTGPMLNIYTDGSADLNGYENSKCGAGIYSPDDPTINYALGVPGHPKTNNRGEMFAALWVLHKTPMNREITIHSDSIYVINMLKNKYKEEEDQGWRNTINADLIKKAIYYIRTRNARTYIQKVKAHSGIEGNEIADGNAKEGLTQGEAEIDLTIPEEWDVQGARLSALKYSDIHAWIKKRETKPRMKRTIDMTTRVLDYIQAIQGARPTEKELWSGLGKPPIRREITDFLWTAMHKRTPCGPFLLPWGGEWADKAYCECGEMETLEHILTECTERPWTSDVWEEALNILKKAEPTKRISWDSHPKYEDILSVGTFIPLRRGENANPVARRLYKIVVSEAAYSIWKLRNAWRIRGERIHKARATATFRSDINKRLKLDYDTVRLVEYRSITRTKEREVIEATWEGLRRTTSPSQLWIPSDHG